MTAAKPLARYGAIERRARERLPQHRSYTTTGDATIKKGYDRDLMAYLVRKHIERWKLPYDVFLSYAGEDIALARELFAKLSNNDLNGFLAQESIEAGDERLSSIRRALRLSNVFVMLLTDN